MLLWREFQRLTTDYFATLKEPRRPWLDANILKGKFLALSTEVHPDRVHQASLAEKESAHRLYLEIHAAYDCLREPKARLRHLLELERGARPPEVESVPPAILELFMKVNGVCREVDAFLAERSKVSSPVIKAQLFSQGLQHERQVTTLAADLNSRQESLQTELRVVNEAWTQTDALAGRGPLLDRLETMYRLFSYFARWSAQLSERQFQLIVPT